jgi:transposase
MLHYEYELRLSRTQEVAIDEAIRTTQFIHNKALRLWMDGRGVRATDRQVLCARLAHEVDFAARLNSRGRQAAASRAWAAIERFYTNCREQRPGNKGYPASSATAARSSTSRPGGSSTPLGSTSPSRMAVASAGCGSSARGI